jgi:hypothetical protein
MEDGRLSMLEVTVLRRIFGPKMETVMKVDKII